MVKRNRAGRWYFRTRVTNPFTGKPHRNQKKCPAQRNTKDFALQMERAWIAEVTADPATAPKPKLDTPIKQVAEEYLVRMHSQRDLAESYVNSLESALLYHVIPDLGDRPINDITDGDLDDYKIKLQNRVKKVNGKIASQLLAQGVPHHQLPEMKSGKLLSARHVGAILRYMHGMFEFARTKKYRTEPLLFPDPPKPIKRKPIYLTFEEKEVTLNAASNDDDRLAILFATDTGARASEQGAFRWEQIDWSKGNEHIKIDRALKASKKVKNKVGAPKSHAERTVPLTQSLKRALWEAKLRRFKNSPPTGLLFPRADEPASPMTAQHFRPILRRALKAAGIVTKKVRWHDLRHTFGSHMAMKEVSIYQIQAWMGHHSVTTTEIYAHLCPLQGRAAMNKAEQWKPTGPMPGDTYDQPQLEN